ncbi:MAG: hypothetical protein ACPG7U_01915 [Holosporaceae bacterium]
MKNLSWFLLLLALAPISFKAHALSTQPLSASIAVMNEAEEDEDDEEEDS